LMIDLLKKGRIASNDMLIELYDMNFEGLIDLIKPDYVIGLSRIGRPSNAELIAKKEGMIAIGGFPRGHFSNVIANNINELASISRYALDTHVVCSRIVYEFEKQLIR
ncbi:MAG: ribosome biogenesis protein, partial [Candidatus Nitrosothermus koennekii]